MPRAEEENSLHSLAPSSLSFAVSDQMTFGLMVNLCLVSRPKSKALRTQDVLHYDSSLCRCHDQQLCSLNPSQERILLVGTSQRCQPPQTMHRQALALA